MVQIYRLINLSQRTYFIQFRTNGNSILITFLLPVSNFERITGDLSKQGYNLISEADHPIALMAFFRYLLDDEGVTEIMGITPKGWILIKQMEKPSIE